VFLPAFLNLYKKRWSAIEVKNAKSGCEEWEGNSDLTVASRFAGEKGRVGEEMERCHLSFATVQIPPSSPFLQGCHTVICRREEYL
jgi:hypothetical protein